MYTWRYHLLTMVAVFLALGVGMLVGIGLTDSGVVDSGRALLTDDLQRNLEDLNRRNDELGREQAVSRRYQDDTFPYLVTGQLQGKVFAVVAADAVGDQVLRDIGAAINSAGGRVATTTRLNSRFDATAAADRARAAAKSDPALAGADPATLAQLLAPRLAAEIGKAGGPSLLEALKGTLVTSTSGNYELPVNAVILVNRADDKQSPQYGELEKQFLLALRTLGTRAVAAETADAPVSEIPLYTSIDVSSVDNVDTRIGQTSIIHVLRGETGAYGVKATAELLIPVLRGPAPAETGG